MSERIDYDLPQPKPERRDDLERTRTPIERPQSLPFRTELREQMLSVTSQRSGPDQGRKTVKELERSADPAGQTAPGNRIHFKTGRGIRYKAQEAYQTHPGTKIASPNTGLSSPEFVIEYFGTRLTTLNLATELLRKKMDIFCDQRLEDSFVEIRRVLDCIEMAYHHFIPQVENNPMLGFLKFREAIKDDWAILKRQLFEIRRRLEEMRAESLFIPRTLRQVAGTFSAIRSSFNDAQNQLFG